MGVTFLLIFLSLFIAVEGCYSTYYLCPDKYWCCRNGYVCTGTAQCLSIGAVVGIATGVFFVVSGIAFCIYYIIAKPGSKTVVQPINLPPGQSTANEPRQQASGGEPMSGTVNRKY